MGHAHQSKLDLPQLWLVHVSTYFAGLVSIINGHFLDSSMSPLSTTDQDTMFAQ
jgi:hypothetical protein